MAVAKRQSLFPVFSVPARLCGALWALFATLYVPCVLTAQTNPVPKAAIDSSGQRAYHYKFGPNPFLPSQAQSADGNFIPASAFPPAKFCAQCHADVHRQWRQSAHANSFRTPFYLRNVELLNSVKGIETSRHCEGCHNPIALFSGVLTTGAKMERPFDDDGVTCMVCHSIQKIQSTSGTGSYVMGMPAVLVKPDGTPVPWPVAAEDILTGIDLHKRAVMKDFYRTPEFCSVCHKAAIPKALNDYRWLRAFAVYDEWQESSWSRESLAPFYKKDTPSTCQTCHMQAEAAVEDYASKNGVVASHRWLGANTAIPTFYGYQEQLRRTREYLKDSVSVDIFGLSRNDREMLAPVERQKFTLAPGETMTVNVVIQNNRIGHSLVPEQRDFYECWVEFEAVDAEGKLFYHSGFLDKDGSLEPHAHSYTNRLVSASGQELNIHQIWETRVKAYDNTILPGRSDLARFRVQIPAGASGRITLTARVNYRRFRQGYLNFALGNSKAVYPVAELASRSLALNIGENAAATPADQRADYLRWNNYGIALLGQVQYFKALEAFRRVVALNPEYIDGYTNEGIAVYTELIDHKREGSDGLGADGLAIGGFPDGTGNLFLKKAADQDFAPALQSFARALQLESGNLRARYHQGVVYRLLGRYEEAVETLRPVVQAFPRFRQARQELGYAYYVLHRYEPAREEFEALQQINPDDITANNYLSYIYDKLGMKEKAREQARLFENRKEDVGIEPVAQEFWTRHEEIIEELAPYHLHAASHPGDAQSAPAQPSQQSAPVVGLAEMLPDAFDFELKDLEGKTVRLGDLKGKAVVLNFWATWCVPCKKEMPWLIDFQKQYGPQGLVILGIAMDDSMEKVRKFAAQMDVNYIVLMGNQALADKYYVTGLPVTIYVDRNGRMTDQAPGLSTRSFMENEIQLALTNGQPRAGTKK
ncbi:MAG: redoxin domain-containing protein [Acidobacteriia bacterium]|nr:redoxin domain-containing protein [Terriglobia bacterium]